MGVKTLLETTSHEVVDSMPVEVDRHNGNNLLRYGEGRKYRRPENSSAQDEDTGTALRNDRVGSDVLS